MTVHQYLTSATELRREAKRLYFLASGATPLHASLVAAAVALERAAGVLATAENNQSFRNQRSA